MAAFQAARRDRRQQRANRSIASPEQFDYWRIRCRPCAGTCPVFHLA